MLAFGAASVSSGVIVLSQPASAPGHARLNLTVFIGILGAPSPGLRATFRSWPQGRSRTRGTRDKENRGAGGILFGPRRRIQAADFHYCNHFVGLQCHALLSPAVHRDTARPWITAGTGGIPPPVRPIVTVRPRAARGIMVAAAVSVIVAISERRAVVALGEVAVKSVRLRVTAMQPRMSVAPPSAPGMYPLVERVPLLCRLVAPMGKLVPLPRRRVALMAKMLLRPCRLVALMAKPVPLPRRRVALMAKMVPGPCRLVALMAKPVPLPRRRVALDVVRFRMEPRVARAVVRGRRNGRQHRGKRRRRNKSGNELHR